MRVIGLDVGEKRIGIAKVDSDTRIAVPIGFILRDGSEWQEIARYMRLNTTCYVVLGLPRSNEGRETAQSKYVRNFAEDLVREIPEAKIKFQDESLTSVVAEERLKSRKKRYEKGEIDAEAAAVILEDFIENFKNASDFSSRKESKIKTKTKKKRIWALLLIIFIVSASLAAGGILWVKDKRAKERAEYYAKLEAEMVPDVFDFTIRPGETIEEIKENLVEIGYSTDEIENAFALDYDFPFLKSRPEGASLEGYLFGDTHEFYKRATVEEILSTYLSEMGKVIADNNLEARYSEHGLSLFEGITLASIVQKEAPSPTYNKEQPTVAQVFLSRLNSGMNLGSDVTVTYALNKIDPNRSTYADNAAALQVDSCYNTRLYPGLPCGPISNPGLSALLAVAYPSETSYLYFLTGDDGLMYYSYTDSEHIQNTTNHCTEFCQISL